METVERWKTKDGKEIVTERSRGRQVKVRLSEEEYCALVLTCNDLGMTQSEYLRNCIMERPMVNMGEMKDLMTELKREGNNLNQIARTLNGMGYVSDKAIEQAVKELGEVWLQLRQFLRAHR